jgi:predicted dehydrogenase
MLNKNVICEKPVTDNKEKTRELYKLAKQKRLVFFEMCMFVQHRQFKYLKALVEEIIGDIRSVKTRFMIPHLPSDDIRYDKSSGGGALLDVGYYPISLVINLFGKPNKILSVMKTENSFDVDLFGSAILDFEHFYCSASWAIGAPYANDLVIETTNTVYTFERIFSKPPDLKAVFTKQKDGISETIRFDEDDHFVNYFKLAIKKGIKDKAQEISEVLEEISFSS